MHAPAPAVLRVVCCAVLLAASLTAMLLAPAVSRHAPAVAATTPPPAAGKKLCRITEPGLLEISGLVATENGYTAIADGDVDGGAILEVFDLNRKCRVTQRHTFQQDPFDPEDLAIAEDGTLWIADTGDNDLERDTVALWKISPDRTTATIHRLTYPDGKHDAEAVLMQPDGKPVIITKDLDGNGVSGVYTAKAALKPDAAVPLTRAGKIEFKTTGTGGSKLGAIGQRLPTGGALSPDGSRAVVRTYTDAYEWRVKNGNVAAALTKTKPIRTPLPNEPQGESIAFGDGGKAFVTATEGSANQPARLYSYVPATSPPPEPRPKRSEAPSWFDGLNLQDIKLIIALMGVFGVLLVFVGVFGIRRSRRHRGRSGHPRGRGGPGPRDGYGYAGVEEPPGRRGDGMPTGSWDGDTRSDLPTTAPQYGAGPPAGVGARTADLTASDTADLPAVRHSYPPSYDGSFRGAPRPQHTAELPQHDDPRGDPGGYWR